MKSEKPIVSSKSPARKAAKKRATPSSGGSRRKPTLEATAKNAVIANELAPAVAIALLEKSEQAPGAPPAALDVLAAGVAASEKQGHVRVQLLFENGAVLPVEMSEAAGSALAKHLSAEVPPVKKPARKRKTLGPARP